MSDKTLQFGVNLNNREPLIAPDYDLQALLDLSSVVEESGFDSVWVGDSLFSKPRYEPLALLSAISQRTSRVRLGTACLVTSTRNPLYLALEWATLDVISGGRAILGIGGGVETATRVYVAPWAHERPHPATAVREAVSVYRAMWRGEKVTLDGAVVHVHDATLDCPLPPPIPILVAARGRVMLRLAGEIADIAHLASLFMDVEHQRDNVHAVLDGARVAGRSPRDLEIDMSVTVSVSSDRERARRDAPWRFAAARAWRRRRRGLAAAARPQPVVALHGARRRVRRPARGSQGGGRQPQRRLPRRPAGRLSPLP